MSSQNAPFPASRKALEDEIAVHERRIIDIKSRLNTMTLIARLPPELLSEVFLHVAKGAFASGLDETHYGPYRPSSYGASRFYAWVQVTHVCRSWRSVALNTPRLWGHIVLTRKPVVDAVLARSKKAPLLVRASVRSSGDERAKLLEDIIGESHRLKELNLSGPARFVQEICPKITVPAHHLESMVLSDSDSGTYGYGAGDTTLPLTLSQGMAPRLRNLEVRRLVFGWNNPVFTPSITRLVLIGRYDSQSLLGTFDHIMSALEVMSNLEVIELDSAIPRLPDDTITLPKPERTIALSKLRRLAVMGSTLDCANLVNHLSLPPDIRLELIGRGGGGAKELIRIAGVHAARSTPLLAVHLSRLYDGKLRMKGWRTTVDPMSSVQPCVELQIDALACSSIASYLVRDSKMFPRVRILTIEAETHNWRWKDVFAGMPNLQILSVHGDPQDEFFTALSTTRDRKKSTPSLILPNLCSLKLSNARLCSPDYDHTPEFLDVLEDWLLLRCNYDLPIYKLHLTDCINLTEEDVERLIEIVPYVEWDGVVQFESEDEEEDEEEEPYLYEDDYDYDYDYDFDGYFDDPWGFF
ncbi:hypothetical protein C8Q79DRAFT_1122856 [Trametes meyenii]|nr:hypothetical protein C8Q79DRAFT_1122856 [Trametes meyenii]